CLTGGLLHVRPPDRIDDRDAHRALRPSASSAGGGARSCMTTLMTSRESARGEPDLSGADPHPLLSALRAATASKHAAIGSSLGLFDRSFSREDYRRILRAFYGYYAPLAKRLRTAARGDGRALAF